MDGGEGRKDVVEDEADHPVGESVGVCNGKSNGNGGDVMES